LTFSRYYRYKLSNEQKIIYDEILQCFESWGSQINLKISSSDMLFVILNAIDNDNPQLYYVDFQKIKYYLDSSNCILLFNYKYDVEQKIELDSQINQAVKSLIEQIKNMTERDSCLVIHDWLIRSSQYGKCDIYPHSEHNILGPLLFSMSVCEGYAKAFKFILDKVKIRCLVVVGKGINAAGLYEEHAWNIVKFGNQQFHVDVTYNRPINGKYISRAYYLLSTKQISIDHVIDNTIPVPECDISECMVKTVYGTMDLIQFLKAECSFGVEYTEVRLSKRIMKDDLIAMIKMRLSEVDYSWFSKIKYYAYGENYRTLYISWV
jgi:transglutaminase/protease-like cytokinesis protein 3